jgi:hypothetical protein
MVTRGVAVDGWLPLDLERVRQRRQLARWVECGVTYAGSLSPKS